jgi:hypothetical protein
MKFTHIAEPQKAVFHIKNGQKMAFWFLKKL